MAKLEIPRWQEQDRVTKGSEGGVIQMRRNPRTREYFPVVVILEGHRRGKSEYPWKGWQVQLNRGAGDGPQARCRSCERLFYTDRHEPTAEVCAACVRKAAERRQRRPAVPEDAPTRGEVRTALRRPWREKEGQYSTTPAAVAEPVKKQKHPDGCLCGEDGCTPF